MMPVLIMMEISKENGTMSISVTKISKQLDTFIMVLNGNMSMYQPTMTHWKLSDLNLEEKVSLEVNMLTLDSDSEKPDLLKLKIKLLKRWTNSINQKSKLNQKLLLKNILLKLLMLKKLMKILEKLKKLLTPMNMLLQVGSNGTIMNYLKT